MQGSKAMSRILIVDDDEDFLHLIGEYLKAIGLEHDLAVSAEPGFLRGRQTQS
jgi:CheY-like chemotaxis protein